MQAKLLLVIPNLGLLGVLLVVDPKVRLDAIPPHMSCLASSVFSHLGDHLPAIAWPNLTARVPGG